MATQARRRPGISVLRIALLAIALPAFVPVPPALATDMERARTFTLDNGLTAVTLHDPAHPVVAVQAFYRVGARNETPGITGIAHFLEHMLFRGTSGFGLKDVTGVIERVGGEWHGYTLIDCTTYFEAAPSALLPMLLRLEAERMTAARMAPAEVEPERGAVFQELRGYQNDARSDLFDETMATLFLQHPYRNNTMGWESDLAGISHADLVAFYRRYYGPRNAVLSIAGDFDPQRIEAQVRSAFADIPPSGESTAIRTVEPPLTGQRRLTIRRTGASPALLVSFLAPPPARPDDYAALLVLDAILGSAKGLSFREHSGDLTAGADVDPGSRLEDLLASSDAERFGTALVPTLYPYQFSIHATPKPGRPIGTIEAVIFGALRDLAGSVREAEVEAARRRVAARLLLETDGLVEVAHELAFWTGIGGLDHRAAVVEALGRVGADDVRRIASAMTPDRAVVGIVLPSEGAGATTAETPAVGPVAVRAATSAPAPPSAPTASPKRAETPRVTTIAPGPRVQAIVDARPAQQTFVLRLAVGPEATDLDPARGLARLRAAATALRTDRDTLRALVDRGVRSTILAPGEGAFAERDRLQAVLKGPATEIAPALRSFAAAVRRALRNAAGPEPPASPSRDPEIRALEILVESLVPAPPGGGGDSRPPPALAIALVSPYDSASVKDLLQGFVPEAAARGGDRTAKTPAGGVGFPGGRKVEAIPGIAQGRLLIALPGEGDPEALKALAWILHHSYGGRLGEKAIAEMGLVYSMDSESVTRGRPLAYFTMGAAPETLPRLEAALSEVLRQAAADLAEEELAAYRSAVAGEVVVRLADPDKAASLWCAALLDGEDHTGPDAAAGRARRLTLERVARFARAALAPEKRLTILVTRQGAEQASGSIDSRPGPNPPEPHELEARVR
jgi:zinc protease